MRAKIGMTIGLAVLSIGIAGAEFDPGTATPAQKKAIAAIEALGGKLSFSDGFSVDLSATMVTDAELAHLEGLEELERLNLSYTDITDVGLAHLEGLTSLESLDLSFTNVTEDGLAHLKGMTELAKLDLGSTDLTAAGLAHLECLTKLRELRIPAALSGDWREASRLREALPGCKFSVSRRPRNGKSGDLDDGRLTLLSPANEAPKQPVERQGATDPTVEGKPSASVAGDPGKPRTEAEKSIEAIRKLGGKISGGNYYGPFTVDFNASEVTDADLIHLKELKRLEILNFTDAKITDAGLDLLNGSGVLASLHVLVLSGTEITDAGISLIRGATRLKSLEIARTKISDAGLAQLGAMDTLERLNLEETGITDAGLPHLKGMTGLRWLNLSGTAISDAGLVHLANPDRPLSLNLSDTKITDAGLAHLKGLTSLGNLNLEGTQITDAGLAHLKGLTSLGNLSLEGTQITDAGLAHLKGLTRLYKLNLNNTKITNAGLVHLTALSRLSGAGGRLGLSSDGTEVTFEGRHKLRWELFETSPAAARFQNRVPNPIVAPNRAN